MHPRANLQKLLFAWTLAFAGWAATSPAAEPSSSYVEKKAGNVTLEIPADWETDSFRTGDEGQWFLGQQFLPDAYIAVVRGMDFAVLGAGMQVEKKDEITFAGLPSTRYVGKAEVSGRAGRRILVIPPQSLRRSGRVAIDCFATEEQWPKVEAIFARVISSVRIAGQEGGAKSGGSVAAPPTDFGKPPPETTKNGSWYVHGRGDYRLRLPAGWKVLKNRRGDIEDPDFDTLVDTSGNWVIICSKLYEKTPDVRQSLERWLGRTQKNHPQGRAADFTISGLPAVRLNYSEQGTLKVIARMKIASQERLYSIYAIMPESAGLDELPPTLSDLLGTLEILWDKPLESSWERQTLGGISLAVPPGWVQAESNNGEIMGRWTAGEMKTAAYFLVARATDRAAWIAKLRPLEKTKPFTVEQTSFTAYYGRHGELPGDSVVLAMNPMLSDGRSLIIMLWAAEDQWAKYESTFERMLRTMTFAPGLIQPQSSTGQAPKPRGQIFQLPCPKSFLGDLDYTFTAYQNAIVVRDNRTGNEETVWTDRPDYEPHPGFQNAFKNDPQLSARLGAALTRRISVLNDSVRVQIFEGGMLVAETAYDILWWRYHAPRSK